MRKHLAVSELLLGGVLGLGVLILFASMAGISTPIWTIWFFLYWGGLIAGPLLIVIGASLTLFGVALKRAAVVMELGSGILSCWAVYLVIGSLPGNGPSISQYKLVIHSDSYRFYCIAV